MNPKQNMVNSNLADMFFKVDPRNERYDKITFIKSLAIISVVLLHSLPRELLFKILAPFHIWQAVPIFFFIAGLNRALSVSSSNGFSLAHEYSFSRLSKAIFKLLIPFTIIWIIELVPLIAFGKLEINIASLFSLYLQGGLGPGSYFIPTFFQFLLVFPLLFWCVHSCQGVWVIALFLLFIILEYGCRAIGVSDAVYRLLVIRYASIVILGIYLVVHGFKSKTVWTVLSIVSMAYIFIVSYFSSEFAPNQKWLFQNSFSYFYTVLLFVLLWHFYGKIKWFAEKLLPIGNASYHIFLVQMVWFYFAAPYIHDFFSTYNIIFFYPLINISICITFGMAFMAILNNVLTKLPLSMSKSI